MSEFLQVTKAATKQIESGNTCCLATVVKARGSAPRHLGTRMLVLKNGDIISTIGGGTLEKRVIEDAIELMSEDNTIVKTYVFDPKNREGSVGLCGGAVDILMEVLKPNPTLLIIGAGHIAKPLAHIASILEMKTIIVDDREKWANVERFPNADCIHIIEYDEESETLSTIPETIHSNTYIVITTWGYDLPALEQAIHSQAAFISLVSSPSKARELFKRLLAKNISKHLLRKVYTPAGLDIGAESPAEVALSIIAEIVTVKHNSTGTALHNKRGQILKKLLE